MRRATLAHRLTSAVLGTVAAASLAVVAPGAQTSAEAASAPYTLMIGDSITRQGREELQALRPDWIIDGVDERNVDRLMPRLRRWIEVKGRKPAQLVVALGTNTSTTWEGEDYRRVRRLLPRARIEFVTPYRSTSTWGLRRTGEYADWMRRIARNNAGVCVAEWRRLAESDPTLLRDGVHPTAAARPTWADLVSSRMDACRAEVGLS